MAKVTVSIPQGTRDFGPEVVRKRNYIFNTIRTVFELYGFQPLETPAMENIETLIGKYGEEGDKLIYRILDSGNPFTQKFISAFVELLLELQPDKKQFSEMFGKPELIEAFAAEVLKNDSLQKKFQNKLKNDITGKALKYDLTIPFARYVSMNHGQLTFPFKRYQIQPVWRADRPQKGRYREFYQCDADVVGSNSLWNEVELATIYGEAFTRLGIRNYELRINHRKLLLALAELCGGPEKMNDIAVAIDKLDKTGLEKVKEELKQKGLDPEQINIIEKYLAISGNNEEKLSALKNLFGSNETAKTGITEIVLMLSSFLATHYTPFTIDPTLARGLNYYTGIIFEVKVKDVQMGSIGGGGRYDDLTGLFGVPGFPGVGISFGVDRIYDVMEELNLFPANVHVGTQVLFFNLGEAESKAAFALAQQLRQHGTPCELYHEQAKFDKQFKYAEKKTIPYIVIIGEKELKEKTCNIKQLETGQQQTILARELVNYKF